jgi:BirA family biotin operon repressor/biotin-[acetyl-CoA-carboxylase] ligase
VSLPPLPSDLAAAVEAASARLGTFARLRHLTETSSTNDVALKLALAGEPHGTSVIADLQHLGRGRRGRVWFSPPGAGVYVSVVLRPRLPAGALPILTLAAGVAAATAVRRMSALPLNLKWPNDLVIGQPWRKLGGVLCETAGAGTRVDAVIVGIGINLLQASYPPDLGDRATSIETEIGRPLERAPLVVETLVELRRVVRDLDEGRRGAIADEWRQLAGPALQRARVRWQDQGIERAGRSRGIDGDGALLVESDGRVTRIVAGEVTWDWP